MSTNNDFEKLEKLTIYNTRKKDTSTLWILYLFLGWSYGSLDKMGTQILFYITLGGVGVWTIIRLFTLNDAIKEYNRQIAVEVGLSADEITELGL